MKVLFVVNNFYIKGNGLSGSARRTVYKLREAGIEVKVLSSANPNPNGPQPEFLLEHFKVPIFEKLIQRQGYSFSKNDKAIITQAVEWADIIHLEEPFVLQVATCKIARKLNKTIVGTYHLHPENLFASIGLDKSYTLNVGLLSFWKRYVFDHCKIVQCPTENAKQRLVKHHFKAELRVISNGLVMDAKYNVITIGRYSNEKDLKTLLKAMRYSSNSHNIQLIFAGQGPIKKKLVALADKLYDDGVLKYRPIFGFYSLNELQKISLNVDLYIHCAYVEVEGLSCMEAIQLGIVPIIAKGELTATSQFALSDKSTYIQKDAKDLATKIDYWLDHEKERKEEAAKYIGLGNKYNLDNCIKEIIKMYEDALRK